MKASISILSLLLFTFILSISPSCFGQVIRVRVINGENGHPLPNWQISVSLFYETGEQKPAKYDAVLNFETDANGEADFKLPEPPPAHFSAQARVDWSRWKCGCGILGSTDELVRKGIVGSVATAESKKSTAPLTAVPGEVLFVARPLTFFERLLYPLMKD